MTAPRIALIHALDGSRGPIESAFEERWPQAQIVNLLDDSLSVDRARDGQLTDAMIDRFVTLTQYAAKSGADGVLFTCSAFHRAIDVAAAGVAIPVLKPDEAMMEAALECGNRLALLATFAPTLGTAQAELESKAEAAGSSVTVTSYHVPGALVALQSGDEAGHAARIVECAATVEPCDAVLMAQFTMAPVASQIKVPGDVPVLTSPGTAVDKIKRVVLGT
ncbi:MAG: arylsulfatase [Chromatiales bacterium]|jgi:aspartate/glutamate racemase|nr:arylsulfatase [Chromatiales bacterium]